MRVVLRSGFEIVPDGKSTERERACLTGRTAIAVRKAHQLDANILIRFHAIRELVQGQSAVASRSWLPQGNTE